MLRPEPSAREIVSDALSKMGQSAQEIENSPEVTSPQKPKKSAKHMKSVETKDRPRDYEDPKW